MSFLLFLLPPLPIQGSRGLSSIVFSIELTVQCDVCLIWGLGFGVWGLGSGVAGGARGWVAGWAGLYSVPRTWVWVVGFSPQILEHPTSICNTGVNIMKKVYQML